MSDFGHDEIGFYKQLEDGRVLRVEKRMFNSLLTLSDSRAALTWEHGW